MTTITQSIKMVSLLFCLAMGMVSCFGPKKSTLSPVTTTSTTPKVPAKTNTVTDAPKNVKAKRDTLVKIDTISRGNFAAVVKTLWSENQLVSADTLQKLNFHSAYYRPAKKIKSSYRMALMMPFMAHLYQPEVGGDVPEQCRTAVDYYEGVKLALRDLEAEGLSLNVDVYDTQGDSALVYQYFEKEELRTADFILGPMSSGHVGMVADFAKQNGIAMVSPLNPKSKLTNDFPGFVQVTPSIASHCEGIVEYAKQRFRKSTKILVLARDTEDDQERSTMVKQSAGAHFNIVESLKFPKATSLKTSDISPSLSSTDTTVIIIPVLADESFVLSALRALKGASRPVVVFGMPKWFDFAKVSSELFMSSNTHIVREVYVDNENVDVKKFKRRYYDSYRMPPTEFGWRGYETMMMVGRALKEYGSSFPYFLQDAKSSNYLSTKFAFKPILDSVQLGAKIKGDKLSYFENRFINILKYDTFRFVRVN